VGFDVPKVKDSFHMVSQNVFKKCFRIKIDKKTPKYELDELSIKINIAILIFVLFIVAYFYI
jgi:hypothetical protein